MKGKKTYTVTFRLSENDQIQLEKFQARVQSSGLDLSISEICRISLNATIKHVLFGGAANV